MPFCVVFLWFTTVYVLFKIIRDCSLSWKLAYWFNLTLIFLIVHWCYVRLVFQLELNLGAFLTLDVFDVLLLRIIIVFLFTIIFRMGWWLRIMLFKFFLELVNLGLVCGYNPYWIICIKLIITISVYRIGVQFCWIWIFI